MESYDHAKHVIRKAFETCFLNTSSTQGATRGIVHYISLKHSKSTGQKHISMII